MLRLLESQPPIFFIGLGVVAWFLFATLVAMPRSFVGRLLARAWLALPHSFVRRFSIDFGRVVEPDGTTSTPSPFEDRWTSFRRHRADTQGAVSISGPHAAAGALTQPAEDRAGRLSKLER